MITDAIPVPWHYVGNATAPQFPPRTASKAIAQEILNKFDQSAIPPMTAFQSHRARTAIEKETTELPTPHGEIPPSVIEVDLRGPRYRNFARAFSTIIAIRKSID